MASAERALRRWTQADCARQGSRQASRLRAHRSSARAEDEGDARLRRALPRRGGMGSAGLSVQIGSVWVLYPGSLRKRLRKKGQLTVDRMTRAAAALDRALPPAGR
jgi:hypothetical protein